MRRPIFWLSVISAVAAFGAAVFWFLSAWGDIPPPIAYYDQAPATDPFFRAVQHSARMNQIAAALSGVSALTFAATIWLATRSR